MVKEDRQMAETIGTPSETAHAQVSKIKSTVDGEGVRDKNRLSSGISDLDPLIEGGFPAGKSYLVTGEAGLGKSIFCIQFVLRGLLDGEKAVYVTVDESPTDIMEEAACLGWDLLPYVESGQLLILDASPFFKTRMGLGKGEEIDISKTVSDLANYVKKAGASRVVIDPVAPLIASRDTDKGLRERARALVHALQENLETTNLLTSYALNGDRMGGYQAEEFPVTGVVALRFSRKQEGLVRTLLLSKMRGTDVDLTEYQFDIVREKGIVLSPIIDEPVSTSETADIPETVEIPEAGNSFFREWQMVKAMQVSMEKLKERANASEERIQRIKKELGISNPPDTGDDNPN
jgi:circadian clock protein KaiC